MNVVGFIQTHAIYKDSDFPYAFQTLGSDTDPWKTVFSEQILGTFERASSFFSSVQSGYQKDDDAAFVKSDALHARPIILFQNQDTRGIIWRCD